MKFKIEDWSVLDLILLCSKNRVDLSPPYQRNFIWTKKDQDALIDSILNRDFPLPTFFILKKDENHYEMVDGQQRTRTILNYYRKHFEVDGKPIDRNSRNKLESFRLSITLILESSIEEGVIEEFYARVNRTGKKLNKPELNKSQYFYTKFLELNEELAGSQDFAKLDLFTENSTNRMNDVDLVSELVATLEFGLFDKKDKVDALYESDITPKQIEELRDKFNAVVTILLKLNETSPLNETRYCQRNDFLSLFYFIHKYGKLQATSFQVFYRVLVGIGDEIAPSNDFCLPLKEYAINCVTQSNSKKAREARHNFLESVLLNPKSSPNKVQEDILEFYELSQTPLVKVESYYTIDPSAIEQLKGV